MQNFVQQFHYVDHQNLPYIKGIGKGSGGPEYFWNGNKRKDHLVFLQFTLSGEGTLVSGGKVFPQRAGDFFLAEVPGKFVYYGEQDWQFVYVEFSPIVRQWLNMPSQVFSQASAEFLKALMHTFTTMQGEELDFLENSQQAFDLFLKIKREISNIQIKTNTQSLILKKYLEKNYAADIGLDQMAEKFELSKFQLIRMFEEAFHYTPMAYLRKYRILRSLELLWENKSIDETAKAVGFTNGNYFAKIFKVEMGMTPTEYKLSKNNY